MNDPHIASNLRARVPGALAELFDAYGDRLFRYCWTMLRNHEIAQIALRDTLVVAEAHIARLADPELLGPWLYSLARAECCRRRAVQPSLADDPPARPSQHDADNRVMAWNAVMRMATDELEALDLTCRHDVDLALVLGVSAEDAQVLLSRARQNLERALGAEMLIAKGGDGCLERAGILDGWGSGTVTPPIRERLLRHAEDCPRCQLELPRNVSAARVFAQLPAPELSSLVRAQVLGLFANPKLSAYREFAVNWASALGESGFPVTAESAMPERARGAAETAAALAGLPTVALPVFGPAGSGSSGGNLSALGADALGAGLAATDWPTADLPAVDVPVADMPATSRPIADVPAARRPVGDMPAADRAAVSAPAVTYRMANPEVASPAEPWFASAKPTPASASSAVPRPAGGGRPRVRRKRAILAGVGTMAAAAAIVSSFMLSGSADKLVTAGGATPTGRTTSPSGLSASSAPILEPPSGASPAGTARAGSRTPRSRPAPLPALAPADGDRREVLITRTTQPLTASSVPRLRTPHQPVAPASATGSPASAAASPASAAASPASATGSPAPAPAAGILSISSGSVDVGTGATSQVTLTAVGGSADWSASMSSRQVRLTSYQGTLQAGQSVTLDIAVNRGTQGGAAVIWIEPPAATPLTVQVAWESFSPGSGHEGQNAQNPPTADPSPSAPLTPWIP